MAVADAGAGGINYVAMCVLLATYFDETSERAAFVDLLYESRPLASIKCSPVKVPGL